MFILSSDDDTQSCIKNRLLRILSAGSVVGFNNFLPETILVFSNSSICQQKINC